MKIRKGFVSNSSTSSFIVIGVTVDTDQLYTKKEVRNCECDLEGLESLYCPKCGKETMTTESDPIPAFKNENSIGDFEVHDMYNEVSVIAIPGTYDYNSDYGMEKINVPENIAELKEQMKIALEPLGLWEEDSFGIWYGLQEG